MLGLPKYNKKIKEHICVKKAIRSKNGSVFDLIIRLLNDKSEVVKSSLLDILKPKFQRFDDTNSKTSQAKLELVEKLLKEASIEKFDLLYPLEIFSDIFFLKRIALSYCSLCD